MSEYIVMPERLNWQYVKAMSHFAAYTLICNWYNADTKVAIIEKESGIAKIYTRKLDKNGNIANYIEHKIGDIRSKYENNKRSNRKNKG